MHRCVVAHLIDRAIIFSLFGCLKPFQSLLCPYPSCSRTFEFSWKHPTFSNMQVMHGRGFYCYEAFPTFFQLVQRDPKLLQFSTLPNVASTRGISFSSVLLNLSKRQVGAWPFVVALRCGVAFECDVFLLIELDCTIPLCLNSRVWEIYIITVWVQYVCFMCVLQMSRQSILFAIVLEFFSVE